MKIDLKKHREAGTVVGAVVVGTSLIVTVSVFMLGAVATIASGLLWIAMTPVLCIMHKVRRKPGKFFTITHITYPSKPFPPAESPAPILSASELEHNATRHRK